jgi:hypothetical protein
VGYSQKLYAAAVPDPTLDAAGRVSGQARQVAAARIAKVRGDINFLLEYEELK